MNCNVCNCSYDLGRKFCPNCGEKNPSFIEVKVESIACKHCGKMISSISTVCPYCQKPNLIEKKSSVCSFCGGKVLDEDPICSICGKPNNNYVSTGDNNLIIPCSVDNCAYNFSIASIVFAFLIPIVSIVLAVIGIQSTKEKRSIHNFNFAIKLSAIFIGIAIIFSIIILVINSAINSK